MILYAQENALFTCFNFTACRSVLFSKFFVCCFSKGFWKVGQVFGFDSVVSSVE